MSMTIHYAPEMPTQRGYYACWLPLCTRPQVLWFSRDAWHCGCLKVSVDAWMGPLPERKNG